MLPQRRKSAEEIAKLRESLGIPGAASEETETEPAPPVAFAPPPASLAKALPEAPPATKKSVALETPPVAASEQTPESEATSPAIAGTRSDESAEVLSGAAPRTVRSLRKSEQAPLVSRAGNTAAPKIPRLDTAAIPQRRHSDRELMEMRRIQAAPPDRAISHIRHLAVPWPLVALGYLLPLAGALFAWLAHWSPGVPPMDFPAQWMADLSRQPWLGKAGFTLLSGLCGLGLVFAGGVAWKKPRSRHHAGFITIIAVLILAFGIIHHFAPTYGP
jgi:hypothetical protein